MTSDERRRARRERRREERSLKRHEFLSRYDDFSLVSDMDNLHTAFLRSKRGVAWKESTQRFEASALRNVADVKRKLDAGESVQHGFVEFDLHERGKKRHIKSVHISERIVQKCLCDNVLVPVLTRSLIYDNGASVKKKGVHFALRRLVTHLCQFYRRNGRSNDGYALTVDFSKFFDSIDHGILLREINSRLIDTRLRRLVRDFVSVFGDGKSLGLGSQVSQVSAIFFPNKLDHFIKEKLRIKFYGRYMDDLYLIHRDKAYLEHCLAAIHKVCASLRLTVNDRKTKITALKDGFVFLKGRYTLLESGRVLRRPGKESAKRMRRKLRKFKALLLAGKMSYRDIYTSYQSWRGNYIRRFDAFPEAGRMDALYNSLFVFTHDEPPPAPRAKNI